MGLNFASIAYFLVLTTPPLARVLLRLGHVNLSCAHCSGRGARGISASALPAFFIDLAKMWPLWATPFCSKSGEEVVVIRGAASSLGQYQ